MRLTSLLVMKKETQFIGRILKKYSGVLEPGNYYIYNSFRAMCRWDGQIRSEADKLFYLKKPYRSREKTAQVLNKLRYFKNRNRRSTGEYQAFYIANNEEQAREIKLFSFRQKHVLYICVDEETMLKQLDEYRMLKHAYPMPHTEKAEQYANGLKVDLIACKEPDGEAAAVTAIARAVSRFSAGQENLPNSLVEELIAYDYEDAAMTSQLEGLTRQISAEIRSLRIPLCVQHGDLSKQNLLYGVSGGKEDYWFVDWEHKRERVFFYDFYFYMLNTGFYGEPEALKGYLSGEFDSVLEAYFADFGLSFDRGKRVDYFLVFAILFLKERVCALGNTGTLKQYCAFIEQYCQNVEKSGGTV